MKKLKEIFLSKKNLKRDIAITLLVFAASISAVRAGNLDSPDSPASTMYTLGDIYGRLTTNQTATEADHDFAPSADPVSSLRTLKEIYEAIPTIEADKVKSGTSYLGISGTLLPGGGSAGVANVLAGETFFGATQADWNLQTGTMPNIGQQLITPGTTDQEITLGFHDGTGSVAGDADLVSTNIRSGVSLFGIDGNSNVVNTQTGDAVAGEIFSGKKAWVDGLEISGTFDASNLSVATVKNGTTFGAGLTGEYPSAAYPLSGDTGATEATASDICTGLEAWEKSGSLLTGTLSPSASSIGTGNTICGVAGTLLKNEYNGSAGASVADSAFYTQAKGGVDDYNNSGARPGNAYASSWTQCNAGNSYCGTNDATVCSGDVCWMDNDTKVIWSDWLDSGTDHTWFWANNCFDPGTVENPGACVATGDDACQCVKKTSAKTGCEAVGDGNWVLPYQKELMQAYIDGSWGNLPHAGNYFWSATTFSYATQSAWRVLLSYGYTNYAAKTAVYDSRCVRR